MRCVIVGPNEAGQRLDKFLHKYMKEAQTSFFYKMMRKKNIVLNGSKCTGNEKLSAGDEIRLFLAEETLEKFGAHADCVYDVREYEQACAQIGSLSVVWEDHRMLAVNKPAGILSQKAKPSDLSLNEWLIGYLLSRKEITPAQLTTFKPSVCNRLDRNTSGLVLCGKSMEGSQWLTAQIRERQLRKFYRVMVAGRIEKEQVLEGWLAKDEKANQVKIFTKAAEGADYIKTGVRPLKTGTIRGIGPVTYAEVELFTGKTHQIRAHLSWLSHPLLGDPKYGSKKINAACQSMGVKRQLLHACCVTFADGSRVEAPLPADFEKALGQMTAI